MTVTRYKRDRSPDAIKSAILGVMRHTPEVARPAEPAAPAKSAGKIAPPRTVGNLVAHHTAVVAMPKERMQISDTVMARAKRKKPNASAQAVLLSSFKAYEPPPHVLPEGTKPQLAMDSSLQSWAENSFTNAWNFANPMGEAFAEGIGFLGYAYLCQLTQRPEFRRISERIAIEMTRKWIRLTVSGEADPESDEDESDIANDKAPDRPLDEEDDQDEDSEDVDADDDDDQDDEPTPEETAQRKRNDALQKKLKKINEDMKRLDVRGKFKTVAEYDGWLGRAHLYIDTGDGDDPDELKSDLGNGSDKTSKEKFKKGSLRNIKHIEATWCYPVNYNAQDPLADDWYNPEIWFAMAKQVHVSRLLTFVGRPVPDILKPSYAFGGLSMSQMAKPYVDNWLRTRQAVTALIESFSVSGIYTNAQSLMEGGGEEVLDRIELFNQTRTNAGSMVLDKESEEYFNISTPLGTLDHLQAQAQEQMSSVSGIPLIVLLGITPTGLNASSEGELRVFYDLIHAMQESLFRDKLKRVIDFIQLNLFGEIDPAIGFEFEPLWSLDEKGEAEVKKIEAETHNLYVDAGVIGQEEVRTIVVADEDSPYNGLDPDEMPPPPDEQGIVGGGAGGAGGAGGSGNADNHEVSGAADAIMLEEPIEVLPGVFFAMDENQFDESKHKRDSGGKFSTTGAGGGGSEPDAPVFKSKKEQIGHMLLKGTTPKDVMQALGWSKLSMPAQAAALGMKLEKYTENGVVKYKGTLLTDAEKNAAKEEQKGKETDAQAKQILQNAGLESMAGKTAPKLNEQPAYKPPQDYSEFVKHVAAFSKKGDQESVNNLMKYNSAWADKLTEQYKEAAAKMAQPKAPPPTPEELKKAKKNTPVPLSSSEPDAVTAIKAFNEKYAGKEGLSDVQLTQKIADYKQLLATVKQTESQASEAAAKKVEENAAQAKKAKSAKEKQEKADLEAQFAADPDLKIHYEAMEALFGGKGAGDAYIQQAATKVNKAGLSKHISGADAVPIIAYSGSHYGKVNSELRRGTMTIEQYKFMKSLNAGLEKMPAYKDTTFRKASLTPEQLKGYVVGHIVEERGFTSTSKNQGTWTGNTQFIVHGKSGRDISKLSSHPGEAEVLFKSGSRFHVKSIKNGVIELEEV